MSAAVPPPSQEGGARALPPFESLVASHGPAVLRVCRALVGFQDADDVWQDTFLAALRVYPSAPVSNYEAWLVAIARNKAMDHHRKAARLPVPAGSGGSGETAGGLPGGQLAGGQLAGGQLGAPRPGGAQAAGGDGVAHAVEAGEDAAVVWAALGTLPAKQRGAVVYHHLAGLPYAEVAGLLGNSEAAARRAAADGMTALRKFLAHDGKGQP
nr:RNA polymerase sigma factor [Arthrobacter livingstonensis]